MKLSATRSLVAACAIGMATAAAPLLADSGTDGTSDTWKKASLVTTYTLNRQLNPFDIDVDVNDGVVTLRGSVESAVERDLAEELARGVDGVREVKNELRIDPETYTRRSDTASNDGRTFMQTVEDANLTAQVKSQLLWNSEIGGLGIDVDTRGGVVSLSGSVDSEAEAELAEQIARNTNHVRDVENHLKVGGEPATLSAKAGETMHAAGQKISDGWVTTKVKSALLYNRLVDGTDIDVDTDNGVVTLRGKVDSDAERDTAVSVARSIKGVKSVQTKLQVGL